jgi:hypothetical protein
MKTMRHILFLASALLMGIEAAAQTNLWVSPTGSGTAFSESQPGSLTDDALKTKILALRGAGTRHIAVQLAPGEYAPAQPLTIGADMAGSPTDTLSFIGSREGKAIITGGKRTTGWTEAGEGIYKTQLPEGTDFRQLYVNGKMSIRARHPNRTSDEHFGPYWRIRSLTNYDPDSVRMHIDTAQFRPWSNMADVEIVLLQLWCQCRIKVAATRFWMSNAVIIGTLSTAPYAFGGIDSNVPYYWENSLDFLDAEGEWYFDRQSRWLYYKPRAGEDINSEEIIYPSADRLLTIAGSAGANVQNVVVQNIEFAYSNWTAPNAKGFSVISVGAEPLAEAGKLESNAMIHITHADNVRFVSCNIFCAGDHGLGLYRGASRNEIVGCHFDQIAANGITLYGAWNPTATDSCFHNRIAHNLIEDVGMNYTPAVGLWANNYTALLAENNEIRYTRYGGIVVGGKHVPEGGSMVRDNLIRHNHVHDIMWVHDDCGGIYTTSRQDGTRIYRNYTHDIRRGPYGHGSPIGGIYLDNESSYMVVEDNVVHGTPVFLQNVSGIAAHDNTVRNNVAHDPLIEAAAGPKMRTGVVISPANNANLASLMVNSTEPLPNFAAGTLHYTVYVSKSVDSVYVSGIAEDPSATVSGDVEKVLPIAEGNNQFTVNVLSHDGEAQQTYTVTVVRATSTADSGTDADLLSLTVNGQPANFNTYPYQNRVGEGVSEAVLVYTKSPYSRLLINYKPVPQQGQAPHTSGQITIPLTDSITTLRLQVWAETGSAYHIYGPLMLIKAAVPPTAVETTEFLPLRVYPNPVTNELTIDLGDEITAGDVARIYNMAGVLVRTASVPGTVNLSHLPAGVYVVRVNRSVTKIIKQ